MEGLTFFLKSYNLLGIANVSEAKMELILASEYNDFVKKLHNNYSEVFPLLSAFLDIHKNFQIPCGGVCPKFAMKRVIDLNKLLEYI